MFVEKCDCAFFRNISLKQEPIANYKPVISNGTFRNNTWHTDILQTFRTNRTMSVCKLLCQTCTSCLFQKLGNIVSMEINNH